MLSGEEIKKARKSKKLTQAELANLVGVSRSAVYDWERGKYSPEGERAVRLAQALGLPPSSLLPDYMKREKEKSDAILPPGAIPYSEETWITLPILDPTAIACAGTGNGGMDTIYLEASECITLPREFIGTISDLSSERPFCIRVEGDSMEEAKIMDGSCVVINPAAEVYDGDPALVCYGEQGDCAVKWVYWKRDGGVEIRSATLKYPPREFTKDEIGLGFFRVIGKVVMTWAVPQRGV